MSHTADITEINKQISFITQNVSDLLLSDRRHILNLIMKSSIEERKIQSKGSGTQIKFKDIPIETIEEIYAFITSKVSIKLSNLEDFAKNINTESIS